MERWRLLDTGRLTAAENMAFDEALLEARAKGDSPNSVRFLQFSPPAVLLGYYQCLEQEVRVDFCKFAGIDINRRITGGGTIFFDESQIGWEVVSDKNFFNISIANPQFFAQLSEPLIYVLNKLGINACFRPRNDIEVNGRKISGTGGTEQDNAFLFQGTLLVDFDINTMLQALRIPIEKLKAREIESAKERVTCLKWEINHVPETKELKKILKEGFERIFKIKLVEGRLTQLEQTLLREKIKKFRSKDWICRIKLPKEEQPILCSSYKTRGGIIKTALMFNLRYNRIQSAFIMGDFFVYPKRIILDIEAMLKDIPADMDLIREIIMEFFKRNQPQIPGVKPDDFITVISKALEKVQIAQFGIPLPLPNSIFVVNSSFADVVKKSPSYLLLPYCSKPVGCEYRYRKECVECGKCNIGEAYRLAKEHGMGVTTIISFEDLIATLKILKKQGVRAYIGCCCEPFYTKHIEDFEEVKLPGILIDINNSTCYDLGKEFDAYLGIFESETEINLSLLKKVLDVL